MTKENKSKRGTNDGGELQDAMIVSPRKIKLTHRYTHQTLTFILQLAKLPYFPDTYIAVF